MRRTPCLLALAAALSAAAPASAAGSFRPITTELVGVVREIVVEHPDRPGAGDDVRKALIGRTRTVALPAPGSGHLDSGDRVAVRLGTGADGQPAVLSARALAPDSASLRSAEPAADPTLHQVYVAIVVPRYWSHEEQTHTAASVGALVAQASDYWSSQTGGKVRFAVEQVLPEYASAYSCSDPDATLAMWDEALGRFAGDAAWGVGKHLLVVLPDGAYRDDACDYGLGTIGAVQGEGNAVLVSDPNPSLYAHELGHNLGLHHSNALRCPTTADAKPAATTSTGTTWPSPCRAESYGDVLDVMGYSGRGYGEGSLNGVHVDRTGLTPTAVQVVGAIGTTPVRISRLSSAVGSVRIAMVPDTAGRFYAEYRTASGRDLVAQGHELAPSLGVRVLREDPSRRNGSYVLDASPTGRADDYAHSVPVGGTFTSAGGTVRIKVLATDAEGADLAITRTLPPGSVAATVPAKAAAGAAVTATAKVRDAAGAAVASWPLTLQVKPKGATAYQTVSTATTGSTGTATFRYTNGITGTYRAVTTARDGAPARTSAGVVTTSSAAPTLATPKSEISSGTRLALTGTLKAVPSPVVKLQARLGTAPFTHRVTATRDGSTFRASYRLITRGTWQLRYYVPADASGRYAAGYSTVRTVKVR